MPSLAGAGTGLRRLDGSTDYQSIDWSVASILFNWLPHCWNLSLPSLSHSLAHASGGYDSMPTFKLNTPTRRYAPFLLGSRVTTEDCPFLPVAPGQSSSFIDIGSSYRPRFFFTGTTKSLSLDGAWWIAGCRLECARYAPFRRSTFLWRLQVIEDWWLLHSGFSLPEQTPSKKVGNFPIYVSGEIIAYSCLKAAQAAPFVALTFNPPTPESLNEEPEDYILPICRKRVDRFYKVCLSFMIALHINLSSQDRNNRLNDNERDFHFARSSGGFRSFGQKHQRELVERFFNEVQVAKARCVSTGFRSWWNTFTRKRTLYSSTLTCISKTLLSVIIQ